MSGRLRRIAVVSIVLALVAGCAAPGAHRAADGVAPLAVYGSTATVEIAPVLLAARDYYPAGAIVANGGIANLVGAAPVPGLGDGGVADIATHAETQALRYSVAHPDLRIILTVAEGHYRIVARRSAGIARLADLKGKQIAALATTSSGYFVARMLAGAGLSVEDVDLVRITPIAAMPGALARGEVDAVAIWEPHGVNAERALGDDVAIFEGRGVYRELFNLNTTAAHLADPAMRRRIVAYVRAVLEASDALRRDPAVAQALVGDRGGFTPDELARSWPYLSFPAALPDDLLDVLVAEEQWLAAQDGRSPRPRAALATLIDTSVYAEARHGRATGGAR
ncbi:ABC transporter substrate-binding protein [Hephaestia sp. GCM10023244]|uniref:ABC transporter substrate-binding protein n=1 Tax=unclassified Hephaestia TaxID=2631281 RepID=UPI0020771564|nr:ABC transporter substrate-binding protein [Hephaestia sp. MAHUQ-44]MCM8732252.1 ABC transporter substrate-binding protein [Hephaestia sp. MAHUQ-44]